MIVLTLLIVSSTALAAKPRQHIRASRERVVRILNHGLAGSPMAGTGRELEAAGWKWKVHPALIAAIAAKESSLGTHACANHFNSFGLSSCGSGWHVPDFRSYAGAYDFMARYLTGHTAITTGWPSARTPWDYAGYAKVVGTPSCSTCWGSKVAGFMRSLFGFSPEVRYGAIQAVA